jgi:CHASE3 domain sensor protein
MLDVQIDIDLLVKVLGVVVPQEYFGVTRMDLKDNKTDQQLVESADQGLRGQGAVVEIMRRLKDSIENLNTTSAKLNQHMIFLTWAILILTAVSVGVAVLQFCVASK